MMDKRTWLNRQYKYIKTYVFDHLMNLQKQMMPCDFKRFLDIVKICILRNLIYGIIVIDNIRQILCKFLKSTINDNQLILLTILFHNIYYKLINTRLLVNFFGLVSRSIRSMLSQYNDIFVFLINYDLSKTINTF